MPRDEHREEEYWIIRIPKPRRISRILRQIGSSTLLYIDRTFSQRSGLSPHVFLATLAVLGILSYVIFTSVSRMHEITAAALSAMIMILYIYLLRRS